jgi:hypothetical protein
MGKKTDFISRFVEACGTAEPARVQRLLNISYQAAKNYLDGRLPHPDVLIKISERTSYSIDWLLTGRGKKIVDDLSPQDKPLLTGQIEDSVRRICVEVINEFNGRQEIGQPKVVVLQSSELMSEKVLDESKTLTGREP